ncbi:MAG: iron-containing alcohol dehydrogenase [Kiritimatiellae bacterium]|nr:iron-containing alcohol dehydrogenase [Kiritimatiellia bacterium]
MMKATMDAYLSLERDPEDIQARSALLWAASLSNNGLFHARRGCYAAHNLGHPFSARYDIPHGRAIACLFPHLLEFDFAAIEDKLALLGTMVFHLQGRAPDLARLALAAFRGWMETHGFYVPLSDLPVAPGDLERMADDVLALGPLDEQGRMRNIVPMTKSDIVRIYERAMAKL